MSRYVPTTDDVKTNYASSMYAHNKGRKIDPHRIFDSWIIAHDAEMREKWEEERRTFKELEIVNDHLIARGVYPEEYPAGEAYGALPYSDAEHLVNLREVSGYRTEEQIRAALAEELQGELPVKLAETSGSDTGWLYDMSDWGPCQSEGNEHVNFVDENGFSIGSIDLHLIAGIAARIARGETGEVNRCLQCGCDLQYPTAVHIVDCGTRKEQD